MATIIAIIVILIVMTVVIFFILRSTVKNINEQGRSYFVLKLQQYDEEQNKDKENNSKEEIENNKETSNDSGKKTGTLVYLDSNNNYEVENLLELVKRVDSKFSFNSEDIVKKFASMIANTKGYNEYNQLSKIKDYINKIGVYNILTSDEEGLIDTIQENIKNIDESIYNKYMNNRYEFDVEDFIDYIDSEMGVCDPMIYVYVGKKSENYDHIDKRIKTIYDKNVYKGIKIIYKNKMYDYSLN